MIPRCRSRSTGIDSSYERSAFFHMYSYGLSHNHKVGAWSHGYGRSSRLFWHSDIDAMLRKLAEYEHNIHLRCPSVQKALEDFKTQQIGIVTSIREVSSILCSRTLVELCSKHTQCQLSPSAREKHGAKNSLWVVITIYRRPLTSGSSCKPFVVCE